MNNGNIIYITAYVATCLFRNLNCRKNVLHIFHIKQILLYFKKQFINNRRTYRQKKSNRILSTNYNLCNEQFKEQNLLSLEKQSKLQIGKNTPAQYKY